MTGPSAGAVCARLAHRVRILDSVWVGIVAAHDLDPKADPRGVVELVRNTARERAQYLEALQVLGCPDADSEDAVGWAKMRDQLPEREVANLRHLLEAAMAREGALAQEKAEAVKAHDEHDRALGEQITALQDTIASQEREAMRLESECVRLTGDKDVLAAKSIRLEVALARAQDRIVELEAPPVNQGGHRRHPEAAKLAADIAAQLGVPGGTSYGQLALMVHSYVKAAETLGYRDTTKSVVEFAEQYSANVNRLIRELNTVTTRLGIFGGEQFEASVDTLAVELDELRRLKAAQQAIDVPKVLADAADYYARTHPTLASVIRVIAEGLKAKPGA